jgi:hypothetical protein
MLNDVMDATITGLVSILLVLIPILSKHFSDFLREKFDTQHYTNLLNKAQSVWYIVEEYFRTNPEVEKSIDAKIKMFENEIIKICPYITDDEISHLRQAVAGQINQFKSDQVSG